MADCRRPDDLKAQLGPSAQFEQHLVLADQEAGAGSGGEFEEFLVVPVLAAGQGGAWPSGITSTRVL